MIEHTIDKSKRLITVSVRGPNNSCELVKECWARIYEDPRYDPAFHHLCHVAADASGPLEHEIIYIRSMLETLAQSQTHAKRWAIVLPSTWKRMLAEVLFRRASLGLVQLRFFAAEPEALKWIDAENNGNAS